MTTLGRILRAAISRFIPTPPPADDTYRDLGRFAARRGACIVAEAVEDLAFDVQRGHPADAHTLAASVVEKARAAKVPEDDLHAAVYLAALVAAASCAVRESRRVARWDNGFPPK